MSEMKTYMLATTLFLIFACVIGGAQGACDELESCVDPGVNISLNGTSIPQLTDPETTVQYAWYFDDWDTGLEFEVYNQSTGARENDNNDGAYFNFSAPLVPGCYNASLYVYYDREAYDATTDTYLTLVEPCVNMTCLKICICNYQCPVCNDTFCDYDCGDFPTNTYPCTQPLCYLDGEGSAVVNWYVINNATYYTNVYDLTTSGFYANAGSYLAGLTADRTGYCVPDDDPVVDQFDMCFTTSDTYKIVMAVYGPGDTTDPYYICEVGTIVQVESPVADIQESITP